MITIIGARAFHCPVRNGKEWFHPAMVVRQIGNLVRLVMIDIDFLILTIKKSTV